MKNTILLSLTLVILLIYNCQSQEYKYYVDLNKIENDKLQIELKILDFNEDSLYFCFPKIIPGNYELTEYGNFVSNVNAYDENGNRLKVKKIEPSKYLIANSKSLHSLNYWVSDTWDTKKGRKIFPPTGSNFEEDLFLINNGCLFGYFENNILVPFSIEIKRPMDLNLASSLQLLESKNGKDQFIASDYHKLIDCPIMYSTNKVEKLKIKNTNVSILVHAENGSDSVAIINGEIEESMQAIDLFLDSVPVKEYSYLMYFKDYSEIGAKSRQGKFGPLDLIWFFITFGMPSGGALEHGNSSVYYLDNMGDGESFRNHKSTYIHEFMHIITPLNLHSEIIENFDYQNPEMSQHLWLYEGVTEYFADLIQFKAKKISIYNYLNDIIRLKLFYSDSWPSDMSFTTMSKNVLDDPYKKQYRQVYDRGAIIAMLLDFEIMRLTDGEKALKDVIIPLSMKYGANKPIKEDNLIAEVVQNVHPDLQQFFDKYIIGTDTLDYEAGFDVVGINYHKVYKTKITNDIIWHNDLKRKVLLPPSNNAQYLIKKVGKDEFAGLEKGDIVTRNDINKSKYKEDYTYYNEGEEVSVQIIRNNEKIMLPYTVKYRDGRRRHYLQLQENRTELQEKCFQKWINN
jgi:predicted metalloprotease with PDZ domain